MWSRTLVWICFFTQLALGANSLTITEQNAVTTTNYPVQIGRPFVRGQIAQYPQAIVGGVPVTTQADVKQRWPDGSVKHAILAFLIPTLTASSTVTVTFTNQATGNNTALTKTQMLDAAYDFNAQIRLNGSSTCPGSLCADARTILNAASSFPMCDASGALPPCLWTSGSMAQTVILTDHANGATCNGHRCSAYDIGVDSNKVIRPIFHVTFWPTINKVKVRFISEIVNSANIANQTYSLDLYTGNAAPFDAYTHASFKHYGLMRFTKTAWLGGTAAVTGPPVYNGSGIAINHNVGYLASTGRIPNYDPTAGWSTALVTSFCNTYSAATKDIPNGFGLWTYMAPGLGGQAYPGLTTYTAGDAQWIGPYPQWVAPWLYSGSYCLQNAVLGTYELYGEWPYHLREGNTGVRMSRADAVGSSTNLGRAQSITGHPNDSGCGLFTVSNTNDAPCGTGGGGSPFEDDGSHTMAPPSIPYLVTGDYWYLEETYFKSAQDFTQDLFYQDCHRPLNGYNTTSTSAIGYAVLNYGQMRGAAWQMRALAEAMGVAPDSTPEAAYFTQAASDVIANEEGKHAITGSSLQGTPGWNFGYLDSRFGCDSASGILGFPGTSAIPRGTIPPLHFWQQGDPAFVQDEYGLCSLTGAIQPGCSPPTVSLAISQFELNYLTYALGRLNELGAPAGNLINYIATFYNGGLTDPGNNPYLLGSGRQATVKTDNTYFSTWAQYKTGYWPTCASVPVCQAMTTWYVNGCGLTGGYTGFLNASVSYLAGAPSGTAAWNLMRSTYGAAAYAGCSDPSLSILPRSTSPVPVSPRLVFCSAQ